MEENWGRRVHAFDALRAGAMMMIVPVHVCSLMAVNGHPGAVLTAIGWVLHLFRLPLFFAMSGFFLILVCERRGLRATLRRRALRIGVPLAVGLAVLVPLLLILSSTTGISVSAVGPAESPFGLAPSYLWFLWYLLIMDTCALLLLRFSPRALLAARNAVGAGVGSPAGIAILAIPTSMLLLGQGEWMPVAPGGTLLIDPALFAYYGFFFVLGMALFSMPSRLEAMAGQSRQWGLAALASGSIALALFSLHNSGNPGPGIHVIALVALGVATLTALNALLALATRHLNAERPAIRYVADSSYWVYLSHLQVLVPLLALALAMGIPWPVALPTLTLATLVATIAFYGLFVRYSVVGLVLNGPRKRPPVIRTAGVAARPA
jgi:glucan biosynthesis protein C